MFSVIIPTYNERANIGLLIPRLERLLQQKHEIIVVDDNSPDGTASIVESLSGKFPSVRLLKRSKKEGLSSAVAAGIGVAKGDSIVVMDADLSHPPELVQPLVAALSGYELVIGSRFMKGSGVKTWPFHRKAMSKGAEMLARVLLGVKNTDPLSGFFAARKGIFQKTRIRTKGYKILVNVLVDNPGLKVKEIPYVFSDRHAGKTKLGIGESIVYLLDLVRIKLG